MIMNRGNVLSQIITYGVNIPPDDMRADQPPFCLRQRRGQMTVKKILVVYSGTGSDDATMSSAVHVAKGFAAHITAICPASADNVLGGLDFVPEEGSRALLDELEARERRREEDAFASFNRFVEREGLEYLDTPRHSDVVSVSWEAIDAPMHNVVERRGGSFDLIVVGQPGHDSSITRYMKQKIIEAAAFSTGRPVLVAPQAPPRTLGETVLIGWNRSAQASRAFHAAKVLLLQRAKKVRILSVTTGAKDGPPADEIADNLAWHGIDCEVRELSPDNQSVGTVLLAEASAISADLLVVGAYTHSRLRQLLLGGVTRNLLSNATIPLFMAH
jgi:nucleotide-binding universal stress UspA family protein